MFNTINRNQGGMTWVKEAISFPRIAGGTSAGLALYGVFSALQAAVAVLLRLYRRRRARSRMDTMPTFIGAWLGRRYFAERFGLDNWRMYTPVLLAGFPAARA